MRDKTLLWKGELLYKVKLDCVCFIVFQDTLGDCLPQFVTRLRDRRVQATYPIQFTCQTVGWPIPEITWYKDGSEIVENGRK